MNDSVIDHFEKSFILNNKNEFKNLDFFNIKKIITDKIKINRLQQYKTNYKELPLKEYNDIVSWKYLKHVTLTITFLEEKKYDEFSIKAFYQYILFF